MDVFDLAAQLRVIAALSSRRGLFAVSSGGLLSALLVSLGIDETAARNHGRRKKRKRHSRRKRRKNQNTAPPAPVIRPDATCIVEPDGSASAEGSGRLAQTFTAIGSGSLVRADLRLEKLASEDGDYALRLSPLDASGVPTNTVLAETFVVNAAVPVGASTVTFTFATPFAVVAGTQYALVLTVPAGDRFTWIGNNEDPCAGQGFISTSATDVFLDVSADFNFTTFVSS
jgi:hypothetical protein